MFKKIRKIIKEAVDSLKNFRLDPIYNLGVIIPCLIVVLQIIHAVVSYILFLIKEGYSSQLNFHSARGNVEGLFGGPFFYLIVLLVFAEIVFTIFIYYRYIEGEKKRKVVKIIFIIFTVILFIFLIFAFMVAINFEPLEIIDRMISIKTIFYVYLSISSIMLIVYSIFMIICLNTRHMYFRTIISLIFSFLILPLLLLLLEHIVTVAIGILIIVAFIIMISIVTGKDVSEFKITDGTGNVIAKNAGGDFVDKAGNVIAKFIKK